MATTQTTTFKELTTAERNAFSPAANTLVFDTDLLQWYVWDGAQWVAASSNLSIGTYDGHAAVANGLQIITSTLYAQSADATHPGMVSVDPQTFAGAKTFSGALIGSSTLEITGTATFHAGGSFTGSLSASNLSGTNTGDVTIGTASGLSITGQALSLGLASSGVTGALSGTDWTTFNNKQASGSYITALTGDVTASGPGSVGAALVATSNATLTTLSGLTTAGSLASVGTITSGTWSATAIGATKGGTAQTAWTTGDLLYASNTNVLSKLGIGAAGQVLTVASGVPSWGSNVGNLSVVSKTADYTISTADDVILCAAGTPFTVTLPTAVGNSGKTFYIKKTDASTNAVTIGTTSTQTIDGVTSKSLTLQFEEMTVVSDNSNWQVIDETNTNNITKLPSLATVGTIGTGVWQGTAVAETFGGTNQTTYTTGDILYASNTNTLSKLAKGTANQALTVRGANSVPSWNTLYQDQYPNYIAANPNAEVDTTGWATYSDGASNIPVDGTGGTATNLTFSRSTSSPLRGAGQFSMVQANSTSLQGKGVSYDFTIDAADKAKPLAIKFDFNASSTFVAGNGITAPLNDGTVTTNAGNSDIEVFIYDVTNSALIYVTPQVITANGANNFSFKGSFQTASNSTSYRLILHIATASANATGWTFLFDNVYVGQTPVLYGPPVTDWTPYTPTGSWSANTTYTGWYRRTGDSLGLIVKLAITGTPTSASLTVNLPTGFTIDTTKLPATPTSQVVGTVTGQGAAHTFSGLAFYSSTTAVAVNYTLDGNTASIMSYAAVTQAAPYTFANADFIYMYIEDLPIAGWSSTLQMSNDTDTRVVSARATGDPASATSGNPIIWPTTTWDTHASYNASTGRYTVPVSGYYRVTAAGVGTNNGTALSLFKNASADVQAGFTNTNFQFTCIAETSCVAGDILDIRPNGTQDVATGGYICFERLSGPASIASTDSVNARYFGSATSLSGSAATVVWSTKDFDSFNAMSSGLYTIPSSGKYQVNVGVNITATSASAGNTAQLTVEKNSVGVSECLFTYQGTQQAAGLTVDDIISCNAGDIIRVRLLSGTNTPTFVASNLRNYFSIARVGN